jgi:arginyl-tRNA synthetase
MEPLNVVTSSAALKAKIDSILKSILSEIGVQTFPDNFSYNVTTSKEKGYDLTFNIFSFTKELKKKPDDIAQLVIEKLEAKKAEVGEIFDAFVRTGSYVQLKLAPHSLAAAAIGQFTLTHDPIAEQKHILIEFSSPNTNKPQHLGHVRNNCLGNAITNILKNQGNKVTKIVLVNDRGIHICKSMLAYKKFGNGMIIYLC